MTVFFLVLTFWAYTGSAAQLAVTDTGLQYASKEACNGAGAAANANYTGGAKVEWTCIPGPPK